MQCDSICDCVLLICPDSDRWYGDGAGNTVEENSSVFSLICRGMWAVKFCTNKILQFLTEGAR